MSQVWEVWTQGGGFKDNHSNKKGRMSNSCGRFQGKCHHCRKYGHLEVDCWEKYGRPGNNQVAEGVVEQEEEVALVGFSLEDNDEPQDNQDDQEPGQASQDQEKWWLNRQETTGDKRNMVAILEGG